MAAVFILGDTLCILSIMFYVIDLHLGTAYDSVVSKVDKFSFHLIDSLQTELLLFNSSANKEHVSASYFITQHSVFHEMRL